MSPPPRVATPDTTPRERPVCQQCVRCHPGRQWGGDDYCTRPQCTCHKGQLMTNQANRSAR